MNNFLIPESFRCLIIGPSGVGKTVLLMKLILSDIINYDNITLFSRSLHQPYYQLLIKCFENGLSKNIISNMFNELLNNKFNIENLDETIKLVISDPNFNQDIISIADQDNTDELPDPNDFGASTKNLVIMDDLIDEKQTNLSKFFTRSRHSNVNIFYISQSYLHLPRNTIRMNSNFIILFKLPLRDVQNIYYDLAGADMSFNEFKRLCQLSWLNQYGYRLIDLTKNKHNGKYRTSFHIVYIPSSELF